MSRTATIVLVVLLGTLTLAQAASAQRVLRYPYGCVEVGGFPVIRGMGIFRALRCTTSDFRSARFDSLANFSDAQFASLADFSDAQFASLANFSDAQFASLANFSFAQFASLANFSFAQFDSLADFSGAQFWSRVYFRDARFDSAASASFARTTVRDTLFLGTQDSDDVQRFDFRRVQFLRAGRDVRVSPILRRFSLSLDSIEVRYPGAAVILFGPVELHMQLAKFGFLHLADDLGYFEKVDIITYLKQESYSGADQALERFELDYLLARSTMRQKKTSTREDYSIFHPVLWWNYLYYATMGLGYRPFWIFGWALGFIALWGIVYFLWIPDRVQRYLGVDPVPERRWGRVREREFQYFVPSLNVFISCLYFSTMVFFTFRLKKEILAFFEARKKYVIVGEWTLGFLVYLAFLLGAKSGSILQQLKTLFIG